MQAITYITYALLALAVVAFGLLAWRDLLLLVRRPSGFGTGLARIWALARTSLAEAKAAKAWAALILWFVACVIINLLVRPHGDDQRERMSIYMMVLLRGQEYLLLILIGVLACFSLPKERERRTIITTASKPISRLELYLGKVTGFSVLAGLMLLVMGVVTYGYLWTADEIGRRHSMDDYQLKKVDYERGIAGVGPPPEGLLLDAQRGVLQANNFIPASGRMQVAGAVHYTDKQTLRFLKGGSTEKMIMRFPTLYGNKAADQESPSFLFRFAAYPVLPNRPLPDDIELQVTLRSEHNPSQSGIREHTLKLTAAPQQPGLYTTRWRPDPEGVVTFPGEWNFGRVYMEITCTTEGVFLDVANDNTSQTANVVALDSADIAPGQEMLPLYPPQLLGFEKQDEQQIEGPPKTVPPRPLEAFTPEVLALYCQQLEVASWHFKAKDIADTRIPINKDGTFTLSMYLSVDKQKNHEWPTQAAVIAYNQLTQQNPDIKTVIVAEKRLTEVRLPVSLLTANSDLYVDVRCLTPGHWIGAGDLSVRIQLAETPFIFNLAKSELVIFAELLLLVVIAVAASLRLGAWVALLVTGVAYLLGNLLPTVQETIAKGPNSLWNDTEINAMHGNFLYTLLMGTYEVLLKVVYFIVKLLPDFRIFNPLEFILDWRNMPLTSLGITLFWTLVFALPFVAVAYLLVRKQELA